jgi:hypothetical protein
MEKNSVKIIVRLSKSGAFWNKGIKYLLRSQGKDDHEITAFNNKVEYYVNEGKHIIEVYNGKKSQVQELDLKDGEVKVITINPNVSTKLGIGILIGFAGAGMIISIYIAEKMSPAALIPLISLLFIKKNKFVDDFILSH